MTLYRADHPDLRPSRGDVLAVVLCMIATVGVLIWYAAR